MGLYDLLTFWLAAEPVKLGLASLAIAFLKVSMTSLTPILAAAQSYGENHVNFTQFGAFSKICGSSSTCAIAGALLLAQGKKHFVVRAPLYAYGVIATAAALAMGAEKQLNHGVGEEWNLSWQCLIIFIVMGFQMLMLRKEFSRWDWLVSGLFVCGCVVSALPWLSTKQLNNTSPWYLAFGGVFVAFVYFGMEGLNQTYQDKLFCDISTTITEQVFFISLFATLIRIIGFLLEFRCLEAIIFHAKHPLSFTSVLLLSFMGAIMTFLMSYMLQLCGALICVMIRQIMMNILAGKSQDLNPLKNALKWIGIDGHNNNKHIVLSIFMLGMLGTTMSKMQHNHHRAAKLEQTENEMEDLDVLESDNERLLTAAAACQILLEACLPLTEMEDDAYPRPLLEARTLICATISSLVHTTPMLLKLLHFQGYEPCLVPMMVEGVPSMVQCLDFVAELMQQPSQQCKVFAVILTAHIVRGHSTLPQSLSAAQLVVSYVSHVRSKVAGCARYLQEVLNPLALCAVAFPQLIPPVVTILQSCAQAGGPLIKSGPSRDPDLQASAIAAFKQLIHRKLLHGRPPPLTTSGFS